MTKYDDLDRLKGKTADGSVGHEFAPPNRMNLTRRVHGEGRKRCVIAGKPSWWRRILRWITGI